MGVTHDRPEPRQLGVTQTEERRGPRTEPGSSSMFGGQGHAEGPAKEMEEDQ